MNIEYHKRFSPQLGRDMEFKVYGHSGRPCLYFPCQDGRFFDFENFHMVDVCAAPIEEGRLQVFTVDTVDRETWSAKGGNPHDRIARHEQWYHYVTDELVPEIFWKNAQSNGGKRARGILTFGCSMGAMHSANFFLRRPDLFDANLSLSGLYSARDSFGDYMEPLIYDNSPIDYLSNMPWDHPYIRMYNERRMIFCVGQGAWEDELKASTRQLEQVVRSKGINAWFDYWGYDVSHDWEWWYKQAAYFLPWLI
ncbi:alpha/beta hydrolase-fold protein [Catenibacillus scindens]|uniref:esterase family protein n=1 Tax=Catenibacillus scindens TaxID=673271 RepID=UPI00320859D1